jgi:hypothetical protein
VKFPSFRKKTVLPPEQSSSASGFKVKGKARHIITTKLAPDGNRRIILKEGTLNLSDDTFRALNRSYHIDASKIFLYGEKPVILYDRDIFEPLDPDKATVGQLEPHYSARADHILRLGFVRQTVGSIDKVAGGFNLTTQTLIMLAIGIVLGYFIGNALPLRSFGLGEPVFPTHP